MTATIKANALAREATFPPLSIINHQSEDHDHSRGRKRHRTVRAVHGSAAATANADDSSNLRGRSRRRASSILRHPSRNSSPSLTSPTSYMMLSTARLRHARREHCPSRPASPSGRRQGSLGNSRRQRTRSKSRTRGPMIMLEAFTPADSLSSLRNEIMVDGEVERQPEMDESSTRR